MNIENFISDAVRRSVEALYGTLDGEQLQIQKTRKEFEGDYTLVTFPLLRRSRKSPEATATEIGGYMTANVPEIKSFNVIKGFLNLVLDGAFWAARFDEVAADADFGQAPATGRTVMIEYSSPNTNKPLHLGHIRNNLLGYSVAQKLRANGHNVIKANLVNDRGIHICKSMLAWKLYGNGETPASSGMKGDHLVGKYYVEFDKHYKAQIKELTAQNQIMQPKAEYFDELVARNLLTNFRETAKELGIKEKDFIGWLLDHKYVYRDQKNKLMPYAAKNTGLFEVKEGKGRHNDWAGTQTLITPKGRETFRLLCKEPAVLPQFTAL